MLDRADRRASRSSAQRAGRTRLSLQAFHACECIICNHVPFLILRDLRSYDRGYVLVLIVIPLHPIAVSVHLDQDPPESSQRSRIAINCNTDESPERDRDL
ncbi:MAG: hypothetical protein [Inoviridae sp.]|nr:MAG: hypothetical protein [Inoviridae sp.]